MFDELTSLGYLYIQNNDLDTILEDAFDQLTGLKYLFLFDNELTSLHEDTFGGLQNLEYLSIGNNDPESLPEDIFDGLSNLKYLRLTPNDWSTLPAGLFDGPDSLESLGLSGDSRLEGNGLTRSVDAGDLFDGLDNLEPIPLFWSTIIWSTIISRLCLKACLTTLPGSGPCTLTGTISPHCPSTPSRTCPLCRFLISPETVRPPCRMIRLMG